MKITDKITITNECNMELMKRFPDKYFDLAIVDPPYGINAANMTMGSNPNRKGKNQYGATSTAVKLKNRILNNSNCDWDNEIPSEEYFNELFRVSKNQIIWGGNYFPLPPTRGIIFWDKLQPWESFSQFELAWTSFDKPAAKIAISTTGGANKEEKIHPTQKPPELYKEVLSRFGKQGDKILDTHSGSASLAIACHDLGFQLDACEVSEQYYSDSISRVKNHTSLPTIFAPEELFQPKELF